MNITPNANKIHKVLEMVDRCPDGFTLEDKKDSSEKGNEKFHEENKWVFVYLKNEGLLRCEKNTVHYYITPTGKLFLDNRKNIGTRIELFVKDYPILLGGIIGGVIGTIITMIFGG